MLFNFKYSIIILSFLSLPPEVQTYIKEVCLSNIGDPVTSVHAGLGVVISTICRVNGLTHWPELLPRLCKLIDYEDEVICKVSLLQLILQPS